jgi:hypothetical protein
LQVDFAALRSQGMTAIKVAVGGWCGLLLVAIAVMYFCKM